MLQQEVGDRGHRALSAVDLASSGQGSKASELQAALASLLVLALVGRIGLRHWMLVVLDFVVMVVSSLWVFIFMVVMVVVVVVVVFVG